MGASERIAKLSLVVAIGSLVVAIIWPEKFREKLWGIPQVPTSTPEQSPAQTKTKLDPAVKRFAEALLDATEPPPRPTQPPQKAAEPPQKAAEPPQKAAEPPQTTAKLDPAVKRFAEALLDATEPPPRSTQQQPRPQ